MGFLSAYSTTDQIDLGDGYYVVVRRHLPGDALERAEAARVTAVAQTSADADKKEVRVETTTNVAAYTEALLDAAIVTWNLTDEFDQPLPLDPKPARLNSIRRLPAFARTKLRDHIEETTRSQVRSPEDQQTFRPAGDSGGQGGEGWSAGSDGDANPGGILDTVRSY